MTNDQRGYTVVELMMAMAVMAVSVTGVMAMQKVTAVANANARDVAVATRIAQAWMEQLHADARLWNTPSENDATSDISQTVWLDLDWTNSNDFMLPTWDAQRRFGPAFDALGRPVDPSGVNANDTVFCTHLRLRRLTPVSSTRGLIRATVRVYWPRGEVPTDFCSSGENTSATSGVGDPNRGDEFHYIYQTTIIRQHTAVE